jgi:hypothetical protein
VTKKDESLSEDSCEKEVTIRDLTRAIEDLASRKKKPEDLEGIIAEAQELARHWKVEKRPVLEGYSSQPLVVLLTALAVALRRDHGFLKKIRHRFPTQLKNFDTAVQLGEIKELGSALLEAEPVPSAKQRYEEKRRRHKGDKTGEIEREFGGERLSTFPSAFGPDGPPPVCLDALFRYESVTMTRLRELFGMDRHRFPAKLPCVSEGKKTWYDLRAFLKIMDALLGETSRPKKQKRGRPRGVWLAGSDLQKRVLNGMIVRAHRVCPDKRLARLSWHEKISQWWACCRLFFYAGR